MEGIQNGNHFAGHWPGPVQAFDLLEQDDYRMGSEDQDKGQNAHWPL